MRKTAILFLAVICGALSLSASTTNPSIAFALRQTRADGASSIHDLESVDYDGDQIPDLAGLIDSSYSSSSAVLNLWHGLGDGTFAPPVSLGDSGVADIAVADVNNDGYKDLVMTSWATANIIVRLGNGNGFGSPLYSSTSFKAVNIKVMDFDGDGKLDAVVAAGGGWTYVGVYKGNGYGTFTELRVIPTRKFPSAVAAADFDGDGRTDIAYGSFMDNFVDVLFQNSNGSMASPISFVSGNKPVTAGMQGRPSDLDVADFNEDGRPDLVASNWEEEGAPSSLVVFLNGGSRTFSRTIMAPRLSFISGTFSSVRSIDLNRDGHADIAMAGVNSGLLIVYIGKGDGTFYSPTYYREPSGHTRGPAFADFDGDGITDAALGGVGSFTSLKGAYATQVWAFTEAQVVTAGDTAPLRAIVSGIGSDTPEPRGSVLFREGSTTLGSADVDATGYAAFDVPALGVATHTIFGDFSGATSARSQNVTQKVVAGASTITIELPPQQPICNSPYSITVRVVDPYGSTQNTWITLEVDGVRTRYPNGNPITLLLPLGQHTLKAYWEGDVFTPRCASAPKTVTAAKAKPSFGIAKNPSLLSVRAGQASVVDFSITGPAGVNSPTGTVSMSRGTVLLTTSTISNGAVSLSATLERGNWDITATYSGDDIFEAASLNFTLSVLPNVPLSIDARSLQDAISIRAVLPAGYQSVVLNRRVAGVTTWSPVAGWSPQADLDTGVVRGVVYEYQVTAGMPDGTLVSNVDPAMLFTDDPLIAGSTVVRRQHFDELRTAVNAARATAGLPPFEFDGTWPGAMVQASHLGGLRDALTQARQALGIAAPAFTDDSEPGTTIKAVHIQELRRQVF